MSNECNFSLQNHQCIKRYVIERALGVKLGQQIMKNAYKFMTFHFSGADAQCPLNYESIGGRCLLFATSLNQDFSDAVDTCDFYEGKLAQLDDCFVIGEVAHYLEENGKYIASTRVGSRNR